jgi:ABC-type multidrug transport system ATPase subunit
MKIELAGVSKIYGRQRALNQLREEFSPGKIVAVVGLNGAGKSTLLQCLAGILSLSEGEIWFDDQPFSRDRVDLRRRFMFLPDFPLYFPWMNALQHIGMVLRLYGKDAPGVEERVIDLLGRFDLLPLAEATVASLSRGQIYKVALTALVAADPELWLIDEPMASGMDALGLREFRTCARAAADAGATILYTTQILSVAEQFSDEVLILHEGRVHARGPAVTLHGSGELEQLFAALRESV